MRKGVGYDKLPEVYLFYISKEDIWNRGLTKYEVRQSLFCGDEAIPYNNGLHTIYVNAEIDDGTSLAKLMQYLKTAEAGDASQGELSQYVNYVKSPKGGRKVMGEFEKYFREEGIKEGLKKGIEEGEAKKSRETAIEMLKDGEPLTKIIKYSKLTKEAILLLAKENGLEVIGG